MADEVKKASGGRSRLARRKSAGASQPREPSSPRPEIFVRTAAEVIADEALRERELRAQAQTSYRRGHGDGFSDGLIAAAVLVFAVFLVVDA